MGGQRKAKILDDNARMNMGFAIFQGTFGPPVREMAHISSALCGEVLLTMSAILLREMAHISSALCGEVLLTMSAILLLGS